MLVLSRKIGERIVIGDNVVVTIVGMRGGQLRLGIEAPKTVRILRDELKDSESVPEVGEELFA